MLGALIPVSEALRTTGGTDLIAAWLSHTASALPPMGSNRLHKEKGQAPRAS
jgi:di/tricarboxylate transporter